VSEQELIALYQHAQFTLYPSLYEGFGIPILEAWVFHACHYQ
jgi:glycosyltransferase involved in cell wall biosynthesis